jgi:hypothetical protein
VTRRVRKARLRSPVKAGDVGVGALVADAGDLLEVVDDARQAESQQETLESCTYRFVCARWRSRAVHPLRVVNVVVG